MRSILPILAALLASSATAQPVYKCTDDKGQTAFQQAPCAAGKGGAIKVAPVNSFEPFPALLERMARNTSGAQSEADMIRELGYPAVTNTDTVNGVTTQQHVYRYPDGSARYVYTRNGEVWASQVRPAVNPRPTQPCYSRLDIENAYAALKPFSLTPEERAARLKTAQSMESCRR